MELDDVDEGAVAGVGVALSLWPMPLCRGPRTPPTTAATWCHRQEQPHCRGWPQDRPSPPLAVLGRLSSTVGFLFGGGVGRAAHRSMPAMGQAVNHHLQALMVKLAQHPRAATSSPA